MKIYGFLSQTFRWKEREWDIIHNEAVYEWKQHGILQIFPSLNESLMRRWMPLIPAEMQVVLCFFSRYFSSFCTWITVCSIKHVEYLTGEQRSEVIAWPTSPSHTLISLQQMRAHWQGETCNTSCAVELLVKSHVFRMNIIYTLVAPECSQMHTMHLYSVFWLLPHLILFKFCRENNVYLISELKWVSLWWVF